MSGAAPKQAQRSEPPVAAPNAAAGARAVQWRNHVFVRPDLYAPHSSEGRKLIGHERVHAGQRLGGGGKAKALSNRQDPAEAET